MDVDFKQCDYVLPLFLLLGYPYTSYYMFKAGSYHISRLYKIYIEILIFLTYASFVEAILISINSSNIYIQQHIALFKGISDRKSNGLEDLCKHFKVFAQICNSIFG